MKRNWYIMLFAIMLLSSCTNDRRALPLLDRAEALLPAQPDSAEVCLNRIPNPVRLSEANGARYALLRSMTDDRQGKGVGSDTLIRDSHEYYRKASHAGQTDDPALLRRYAQSCYYMSLFYSSCDSTKQCEDLLHQAIKSSEKCEDWHTCYLAYTMLGITTNWSNPEYAARQVRKALETYHKINDDVNNEVLILGHIAGCFLTAAEPDSALKYYNWGLKVAKKNHLIKSHNEMCMGLANTFLYKEEYEKALQYAKDGISTANDTVLIFSQLTLAQCYQACDSMEQAKEIYNSINCEGSNPMNKYFVFKGLSEIAIQQKDLESLVSYIDSTHESMEDRFLQSQQVKDEYYQSNIVKELEKEQIRHEAERHKWVLGVIILCVVFVSSSIIYNVYSRKKHMQAEHQKEIKHQNEIIRQKTLTLTVIQKHLLEKLEHVSQIISDTERIKMTEEAWKELEYLLDDTDNHFVQNLRQQYKDFKEEDIQLCMLIRLRMDNAVVSNIYHISVSAVKKRKLNLKKNGFHVTDPAIHLEEVIERL